MNVENITKYQSAGTYVWIIMQDLGIDLGDASSRAEYYHGVFIRWIFQCASQIGATGRLDTKSFDGTVTDRAVIKPCDYVKLIEIRVGNCGVQPMFQPIYPQQRTNRHNKTIYEPQQCNLAPLTPLNVAQCYDECDNRNSIFDGRNFIVQETDSYFNFNDLAESQPVKIKYTAYRFDDSGYPLVDSNYAEAFTAYCRWKYMIQQRTAKDKNFTQGDEAIARADYNQLAREAYGRRNIQALSDDLIDQILARWSDPMYVKQNPRLRNIINQNTLHNNSGFLSPDDGWRGNIIGLNHLPI